MQTSYSLKFRVGRPGLIADLSPRVVVSRSFRSVPDVDSGALPFGAGASQSDVDDTGCYMPAADVDVTSKFLGIVVASSADENSWGPTGRNYLQNETPYIGDAFYSAHIRPHESVPVLVKGRIWVHVEAAVHAGDQAFLRVAVSNDQPRGTWSGPKTAGGSSGPSGTTLVPKARFVNSSGIDNLAILEIW